MASRRIYDPEFRKAAVEKVRANPTVPIRAVAAQLNVSESTLRRWVKHDDQERASSEGSTDRAPMPDVSEAMRAAVPKIDFADLVPKVDFSSLVMPKVDFSSLVMPKVDFSSLVMPKVDFSSLVMPKVDFTSLVMPKFDFSSLIPKETLRAAHELAERLRQLLPPNWEGTMPEDDVLLEILNEDGIPLVWVPRSSIVDELVTAEDRAARLSVLELRRDLIIEDCYSVLGDIVHTRLVGQQPLALKAVEALDHGHAEAAQALAVVVTETAVSRALSGQYGVVKDMVLLDLDDTTIREFRLRTALAPIGTFYTSWWASSQTPPPEALSRHVSVHNAATGHYTSSNAIVAVMLMSSVLRALDEYWADTEPPASAADAGDA